MKLATCLALTLLLCFGAAWANETTNRGDLNLDQLEQMKNDYVTGDPDPQGLVGGEDIANAAPIVALPYSDGGSTCGYLNDYDEACPFTGSTSPDVVYSYAGSGLEIDIDLCDSLYDTKVYVYENAAGNLVACNDDACGSDGFRSELTCVPTVVGSTYYIVVDGYGGACGEYVLNVSECVPCIVDCPPGSVLEGEVDCYEGYDDNTNGGCNSTPNVWTELPCAPSMTVCGTYGGFFHPQSGFNYRDTDWYKLPVGAGANGFTVACVGEHPTIFGYLAKDCISPAFEDYLLLNPCEPGSLTLPPGEWWIFVATNGFGPDFPCGADYTLTIDGLDCEPIAIDPATWGEIKGNYR
jgi:hypothetical protein